VHPRKYQRSYVLDGEERERRAVMTRKGAMLMNTSLRTGRITGALVAMLLACGLVACTTQEAPPAGTGGSGGTAGGGSGGTTPAGGAGGSTIPSSGSQGVLCPTLPALITNFDTATAPDGTQIRFGGAAGEVSGGGSVWGVTSEIVQSAWHISGTVSDYAGFNIYFDNCTRWDASKFKGISFTLSGTAANQGTPLSFSVTTVDDTPSAAWLISQGDTQAKTTDVGTCTPTSGNGRYYHPGCADPTKSITVPTTPTPQTVLWGDLSGGQPDVSPKPEQITGIYWVIPWGGSGSATYPADITIDELKFIE
jgi:hypothetical protein